MRQVQGQGRRARARCAEVGLCVRDRLAVRAHAHDARGDCGVPARGGPQDGMRTRPTARRKTNGRIAWIHAMLCAVLPPCPGAGAADRTRGRPASTMARAAAAQAAFGTRVLSHARPETSGPRLPSRPAAHFGPAPPDPRGRKQVPPSRTTSGAGARKDPLQCRLVDPQLRGPGAQGAAEGGRASADGDGRPPDHGPECNVGVQACRRALHSQRPAPPTPARQRRARRPGQACAPAPPLP